MENSEKPENNEGKNKFPPQIKYPIIALVLDFLPLVFWALMWIMMWWFPLLIIDLLLMIFSPVAGIGMGIYSLCLGREQIGKSGVALSVIAIALPIVVVTVAILLLSTGVFVIRFM